MTAAGTWTFFRVDTGDMMPQTYSGPEAYLAANTPPGCVAVEGVHDRRRARLVFADDGFGRSVAAVVPRKPPKPVDTDFIVWEWDDLADDWVSCPTVAARRATVRAARDAELQATDGPAIAALEEGLLVVLRALGRQIPASALLLLEHRAALRALPERPDFDRLTAADVPRYVAPLAQAVNAPQSAARESKRAIQ